MRFLFWLIERRLDGIEKKLDQLLLALSDEKQIGYLTEQLRKANKSLRGAVHDAQTGDANAGK